MPLIAWCLLAALCLAPCPALAQPPEGFVYLDRVAPDVIQEMRYFGEHNFVGAKVDGYDAPRCILTKPAAQAVAKVQARLKHMGLSLKVYDCYRPQRAVEHFKRWAKDIGDTKTKAEFYPTIDKRDLFKLGLVAERSSHSRGSTVDLTIVPLPAQPQPGYVLGKTVQTACYEPAGARWPDNSLDMGTGFDCFHGLSATANPAMGPAQRAHRALLLTLMAEQGFVNLAEEWWHFTLGAEPFPDKYFDFPVR